MGDYQGRVPETILPSAYDFETLSFSKTRMQHFAEAYKLHLMFV